MLSSVQSNPCHVSTLLQVVAPRQGAGTAVWDLRADRSLKEAWIFDLQLLNQVSPAKAF